MDSPEVERHILPIENIEEPEEELEDEELEFDEADALFSERPKVKDSHDRYAN